MLFDVFTISWLRMAWEWTLLLSQWKAFISCCGNPASNRAPMLLASSITGRKGIKYAIVTLMTVKKSDRVDFHPV
tara:strand:- start:212 stop:436 length:225 start_codon:yes stop_codon:yes gene_type:complete